ncbi:MAG: winged helix-turn-helix domain-containing protein [Parvularcula sp.]|jgi:DNA-binding winged helix-turn-helix (wHTH) protein|nr:winged helix-turn-helix domain-containing protein [Parvularcula sp.]
MSETIKIGDVVIDKARRQVTRAGESVELSDLSFDLVAALAEAAPQPLSNQELAERVWRRSHVTDHTIAQRVAMVRRAFGDNSDTPRFVRTVRGQGYAFVVPQDEGSSPVPTAASGGARRGVLAGLAAGLGLIVTAAFVAQNLDRNEGSGAAGDIAAVIVDPETGAVRLSGSGARFMPPVLAEVDGKPLFVGSVPDLEQLEGSPPGLAALCSLAANPGQSSTPVPRALRDFMASPAFEEACEDADATPPLR